jgi:GntR family transcriptional repressor for pyruvate dehydrogenase complex
MYRKMAKDKLYESIAAEVERLIVGGMLKPGDILPAERELGERFGVSRTTVREAIKVLTQKGLLVVQTGRGAMVARPSFDVVTNSLTLLLKLEMADAQQLTEVRMALEPDMAALAAARATEEQARELETIALKETTLANEGPARDLAATVALDITFHTQLWSAANNLVARAMLLSIQSLLHESMTATYETEGTLVRAAEAHLRVARAIHERDPRRAADEMRAHLVTLAQGQGVALLDELQGASRPSRP